MFRPAAARDAVDGPVPNRGSKCGRSRRRRKGAASNRRRFRAAGGRASDSILLQLGRQRERKKAARHQPGTVDRLSSRFSAACSLVVLAAWRSLSGTSTAPLVSSKGGSSHWCPRSPVEGPSTPTAGCSPNGIRLARICRSLKELAYCAVGLDVFACQALAVLCGFRQLLRGFREHRG